MNVASCFNEEQLAWILPHFCCPDCKHIDFLIEASELPQWLKFGIDYLNKEGGFECKLCGKVYQSLGFLDTHLLKIECVPKETIHEFRTINCRTIETALDIEKLRKIISNESLRKEWTDDEVTKLIELRRQGKSNEEMANIFGRKVTAISSKIHNLINEGKLEKVRLEWSDEETAKLIELRNASKSHKEIALEMNKTASCITQRISKLMKEGKIQKLAPSTNDEEVVSYVKELYHTETMKNIANALGLSVGAIYIKLNKKVGKNWKELLGLNIPKPKACKKENIKIRQIKVKSSGKRKPWTAKEKQLLFSSKDMDKIAKQLGRSANCCYVMRHSLRKKRKKR